MNATLRTVLAASALVSITSALQAQDRTKEGYALSWTNTIAAVPDSVWNGTHRLPAFSITVFESDGGDAMSLLKDDMKAQSKDISGSKPMKVSGAMIAMVSPAPIMLIVESSSDRKADQGILKIAYAVNDSTVVDNSNLAREHARSLSVTLNKANVQKQLDMYDKTLDKTSGKLESAQKDVMKNEKNLGKANKALAKATSAISKIQATNAEFSGRIVGLEKKFAVTNDPNDLKALTKMRTKLASSETKLAKQMKSQAKAQDQISKYQGNTPDQVKEEAERAEAKKGAEVIIVELKKKQEAIK